jgi:hypothetical protein
MTQTLRTAVAVAAAVALGTAGRAAAQDPEADLLASPADAGPSLRLSGFADVNYTKFVYDDERWAGEGLPEHGAFSVGNLNLYLDGRLDPKIRSLIEVRFTYLPNGVALQGDVSPAGMTTGTRVTDYAQLRATAQWGGIVIERAWVEYRQNQALTIRAGQFLTPYGVWNVDHGSPTLIDVAPPFAIGQELLPKSQVGVEAYGDFFLGDAQLGWHLTASNGRIGNNAQFLDLDSGFGLGGRVFVAGDWLGDLKVGASLYRGDTTDRVEGLVLQDPGVLGGIPLMLPWSNERTYSELGWGVDFNWQWKGLVVIAELLSQQLTDVEDATVDFTGTEVITPHEDFTKQGWYALAGYRLPFQLMPFVMVQYVNDASNSLSDRDAGQAITAGLNWRLRPNVVLKASYTHTTFPNALEAAVTNEKLDWFQSQVAWAF